MSAAGRKAAETCTYHVTASRNGFLASCREMNVGREGDTVAHAVDALRTAIEASHHES
jgi:hypothetical protein